MPTPEDWPALQELSARLHALGYTEHAVSKAMGVDDFSLRELSLWPAHLHNCRQLQNKNPIALLSAFFLLEEPCPPDRLRIHLGETILTLWERLEWTVKDGSNLIFRYKLYPFFEHFILTDGGLSQPSNNTPVPILGSILYQQARLTPRLPQGTVLSIPSGAGGLTLLCAKKEVQALGFDDNVRSRSMAQFNATWNTTAPTSFRPTKDIPDTPCDLIIANLPFHFDPSLLKDGPDGTLAYDTPLKTLLGKLTPRLHSQGLISLTAALADLRTSPPVERLAQWLDRRFTWSILWLTFEHWSPINLALAHHPNIVDPHYGPNFIHWLDACDEVDLKGLDLGLLLIFRSHYPWRIQRPCQPTSLRQDAFLSSWLKTLRSIEDSPAAHYILHPDLNPISWTDDKASAYVSWPSPLHWWDPQGVWVHGLSAQLLAKLEQGQSLTPETIPSFDTLLPLFSHHLITVSGESA